MNVLEGNSQFCSPIISMFPEMKSRETKFTGFLRDRSLSDLLYSTTKTMKQTWKTKAVNIRG